MGMQQPYADLKGRIRTRWVWTPSNTWEEDEFCMGVAFTDQDKRLEVLSDEDMSDVWPELGSGRSCTILHDFS